MAIQKKGGYMQPKVPANPIPPSRRGKADILRRDDLTKRMSAVLMEFACHLEDGGHEEEVLVMHNVIGLVNGIHRRLVEKRLKAHAESVREQP